MFLIDSNICNVNTQLIIEKQKFKNICSTYYFDKKIKPLVITYSRLYNIEPHYVFGIIAVESKFKIKAKNVNKNGTIDKGLMQINNSNFDYLSKQFNVKDMHKKVYKPEYNIKFGVHLLAKCKEQFKDINLAIDCYNKGPNKQKLSRDSAYVKKVKQYAYQYKIYQKYDFSEF